MLILHVIFYYVLLYIAIKSNAIAKKIWKKDMIQSIFANVAN